MRIIDFLLGPPLASWEDRAEKIGPAKGIPIFGLDALGSAAYGPEAALTVLMSVGVAGIPYVVPLNTSILVLLAIVCFSYLQTIPAYPGGGGAYTVASENLGRRLGLLAGAALMIDYVLVVAVGISAGIGALVSAVPQWQPMTLPLCLFVLLLITTLNLRGVRETGTALLIPTYVFLACLLGTIALGLGKTIAAGGHPLAVVSPPKPGPPLEAASMWLLLKAFSSGCTAMTGVEAVSNGVTAFREPRTRSAQQTLITVVGLLALMLAGIAVLCRAYGIGATPPGQAGYQSILSQLIGAVTGRGWFYDTAIVSILLVLALQANTAFAGFPRLCRALAEDGYLPSSFASRGRRLVYSQGIWVLVFLSGSLLILFGGITDRLIPLFAIGAFLAFTLSQAGMVGHWKRTPGRHRRKSMVMNGVGAIVTALTLIVVIISKFAEGAWVNLVLIPAILAGMRGIKRHYDRVAREVAAPVPLIVDAVRPPLVVVPIESWNRTSQKALRFALSVSQDVVAVHVQTDEKQNELHEHWEEWVRQPAGNRGLAAPQLVVLPSPYRYVINPILDFVLDLERCHPDRQIAVTVPNLVERRWFQRFLHNQRGELLTALLLLKGDRRIAIVNVPWYTEV